MFNQMIKTHFVLYKLINYQDNFNFPDKYLGFRLGIKG